MRDAAVYNGLFEKIALRTWSDPVSSGDTQKDLMGVRQYHDINKDSPFARKMSARLENIEEPQPRIMDYAGKGLNYLSKNPYVQEATGRISGTAGRTFGTEAIKAGLNTAKQDPTGKVLISGAETLQKGKDMLSGWGDLFNFKGAGIGGLLGMALLLLLSRGKIGMGILGLLGGGALGGFGTQYALKNKENISGYLGQHAAPLKGPFDWSMDKLAPTKPVVPPVPGQR